MYMYIYIYTLYIYIYIWGMVINPSLENYIVIVRIPNCGMDEARLGSP